MSFFSHLEGNLEKYIEGLFRDRQKGQLHPVEIARRLLKEMREHRRMSINRVYVPNEYTVYLSAEDFEVISSLGTALAEELAAYLQEKAAAKNYTVVGKPQVIFRVDEALGKGQLRIGARFTPTGEVTGVKYTESQEESYSEPLEDTIDFTPSAARMAVLEITTGPDSGRVINLLPQAVVIGRQAACEIVLADRSVSRRHALLEWREGNFYLDDLGSTNGTFVNGERITGPVILRNGDVLRFGNTEGIFREL